MNLISTLYILCAVGLSLLGDVFFKKAGGLQSPYFYAGLIIYALSGIPAALAFKKIPFAVVFIVWESLMIILGIAIGYGYFKEPVSTNKLIALVLCLAAIAFAYL